MEFIPSAELKKRMRADVLYNSVSSGSHSNDCYSILEIANNLPVLNAMLTGLTQLQNIL